jgi:hypothetical protein
MSLPLPHTLWPEHIPSKKKTATSLWRVRVHYRHRCTAQAMRCFATNNKRCLSHRCSMGELATELRPWLAFKLATCVWSAIWPSSLPSNFSKAGSLLASMPKWTRSLSGNWDRVRLSVKRKASRSSMNSAASSNSISSQVSDDPNGPIYSTLQRLFDTLLGFSTSSTQNARLSRVHPVLKTFVDRVAEAKKCTNDSATNIILTSKQLRSYQATYSLLCLDLTTVSRHCALSIGDTV